MERIRPPVIGNYIVWPDSVEPIALESVSELGIYGYILRLVVLEDELWKNHLNAEFKTNLDQSIS